MRASLLARATGAAALVGASCLLPTTPATAAPSAVKTVTITIKANGVVNGFTPSSLTIRRGTRVVVTNHDSMRHTMTSNAKNSSGNPLFSTAIAPHSSATIAGISTLAAGGYRFYCAIHPNMRGALRITGSGGGTKGATTAFRQPLVVPRQLTGASVSIPVGVANVRALPTGPTTPMWTFGGTYPGPTISEHTGHATDVTFTDRLPASTGPLSIHLHGDHHTSADDGLPATTTGDQTNVLLDPGQSRTYHYSLADSAAPGRGSFDFYHDHSMGRTGRNNYYGLQGMFVRTAPIESQLGLPHGFYDLPLMVSDRSFNSHNHIAYSTAGAPPNDTTVGTHILVNGRYLPFDNVAAHRYRLRLLNASNYQSYDFSLSDGRQFDQIGTGDGLLPHSVWCKDIILGPAQRADVVVNFAGELGHAVVLRSIASTDKTAGAVGTPTAPLMQFRVTRSVADPSKVPYDLQPAPPIDVPSSVSQEWDFGIAGSGSSAYWTVNGQRYDPSTVMREVPQGSTELWTLRNDTEVTHYIHLHEEAWHTVARIDANGVSHPPPAWENGLEDTWRLDPHTAVEVAARFADYPGVFMIHCHMLGHEDDGMMAQFAVVDPANPMLPAGYTYRPLSGAHRQLAAANGSGGSMAAGMATGRPMSHRATGTSGSRKYARPAAASTSSDPGSSGQLLRSVGIEAGLLMLLLAGLRVLRVRKRATEGPTPPV